MQNNFGKQQYAKKEMSITYTEIFNRQNIVGLYCILVQKSSTSKILPWYDIFLCLKNKQTLVSIVVRFNAAVPWFCSVVTDISVSNLHTFLPVFSGTMNITL